MLKETYFANIKKLRKDNRLAEFVCVSRAKAWFATCDKRYTTLAPSQELYEDYKNNRISWADYTVRFKNEMNSSRYAQKYMRELAESSKRHDVFLVCWEGKGKNCHRYILLEMIEQLVYEDLKILNQTL
jgi:uncharacterized protein YeaO (DUF488 family)